MSNPNLVRKTATDTSTGEVSNTDVQTASGKLKNYIINGNFDFWQRGTTQGAYGGSGISNGYWGPDRWGYNVGTTNNRSGPVMTQSSNVPTVAQSGFQSNWSFQHAQNVALTLVGTDYFIPVLQRLEGYDYARIHGGKQVTLGFWFYSTVAGQYPVSFGNSNNTRSYCTLFTYNVSNTWQYVTVTLTTDTSQTGWNFTNGIGMNIYFCATGTASYQTSTLGSWVSGNTFATSSGIQVATNASVTFNLAQVSLIEGSIGLAANGFQRAGRTAAEELRLCQRYYEKSYQVDEAPGTANGSVGFYHSVALNGSDTYDLGMVKFLVNKRAIPTISSWAYNGVAGQITDLSTATNNGNSGFRYQSINGFGFQCSNNAMGFNHGVAIHWAADAEL